MADLDSANIHPPDSSSVNPRAATGSLPYAHADGSHLMGVEESHLLDYVKVLHRRRWMLVTAFLIVFVSVAVRTFTTAPVYEGRVQLLIEAGSPNVVSFKEVIEQDRTSSDYYQTQYRLIQSRTLARRTLDALNLWEDPRFRPRPTALGTSIAAVRARVRSILTGESTQVQPSETAAESQAIDNFLSQLTVTPVRNSRLVDVRFESTDAQLAADIANRLVAEYIAQHTELKYRATREASDWLSVQLEEQRQRVDQSERALQAYRDRNDALALEDTQNIVVQTLTDLNAAATRAKMLRIERESEYNQVRLLQLGSPELDTIPAIMRNALIQSQRTELAQLLRTRAQQSERFGDRHPEMVSTTRAIEAVQIRIQAEIGTVVESLRNQFLSAQAQEESLTAALEQQKAQAMALNNKAIEYGTLQREAVSNREIFQTLMQRSKEAGISSELRSTNVAIVDRAERPRGRIKPNRTMSLLIGLIGGVALAIALVLFVEHMDSRLKTPDEITRHLRMSVLGMVPMVDEGESALLHRGVPADFAESLRAVRTNVLFSLTTEGGRSLVVTSAGPGEGKTLISGNLAIALSQTGHRVLLLDADMRRPRAHQMFDHTQDPGLSNLLVSENPAPAPVIRATSVPGLHVMSAGVLPPNPAELLGSQRFQQLLARLKEDFHWIIIDSPPVMAVTDAALLAHVAEGVVFVVGAGMTDRDAAQQAVELLKNGNARFVGCVLNRVDLKNNSYYYSRYYRREYAEYYMPTGA